MKTRNQKLLATMITLLSLTLLPGCLDIYFTTEIKPNGDIAKTIVLEGDSVEIMRSYLPVVSNESWEREWIRIDKDKSKLVLNKTFTSDRKASMDLNPDNDELLVRIVPELKRKFRWFFTYYVYTDKILASNPYSFTDWRDYFTEEEIRLIAMDEDDREADPDYAEEEYKQTEERLEEFFLRSPFEEIYELFLNATAKTTNIDLTKADVASVKEDLFRAASENENGGRAEDIIRSFANVLPEEDVQTIWKENREVLERFDMKEEFFEEIIDDNMYFTIRMPGLLIQTNSLEINGNSLSWEVDSFDAFFYDYVMSAESRILNVWAFVVSGLLLILLLIYLIRSLVRATKKHQPSFNQ